MYQVTQTDTGSWKVSRTDGAADYWHDTTHLKHAHAEVVAEVAVQLPAKYHIEKIRHTGGRSGFGKRGIYWKLYGGITEDPSTLDQELPESTDAASLVLVTRRHADGAAERIAKKNAPAPERQVPARGWSKESQRRSGGSVHGPMEAFTGVASHARPDECHYCGLDPRTCDCW